MSSHDTPIETAVRNDAFASARAETLRARGNLLYKAKQYAQAEEVYRQCLELDSGCIPSLSNLSAVHLQLKNWAVALQFAQEVLVKDPLHKKCLSRCGRANVELQQYAQALACLTSALQQVHQMLHTSKATSRASISKCDIALFNIAFLVTHEQRGLQYVVYIYCLLTAARFVDLAESQ